MQFLLLFFPISADGPIKHAHYILFSRYYTFSRKEKRNMFTLLEIHILMHLRIPDIRNIEKKEIPDRIHCSYQKKKKRNREKEKMRTVKVSTLVYCHLKKQKHNDQCILSFIFSVIGFFLMCISDS